MITYISITIDTLFSQYSEHLGYLGIFLFFLTVDQLTPIPEEITLLTIGYLASNHVFNPIIAGLVSFSAFMTVDIVYFMLARSGSRFIKKVFKSKSNSLINRYKEKLRNHFGPTLILLCFIPRMRLFGPVFSGIMGFSIKKFILFDSIGILLFTTLYIILGVVFHVGLHSQMQLLERYQHYIFVGAMLFLTFIILRFLTKSRNDGTN